MDCPHCGYVQPEGVECVQCHAPLGELADLLKGLDLARSPMAGAPAVPVGMAGSGADGPTDALADRVRLTTGAGFSGLMIRAYRKLVAAQVWVRLTPPSPLSPGPEGPAPVVSLRATDAGAYLDQALAVAIGDLRLAAVRAGGNAVISVVIGYHGGFGESLLMTLSGTAVEVIRERRA